MDLARAAVMINCPRCSFQARITLGQIERRDAVICRGCKCVLRLEDHMNTFRLARRHFRAAISKLEYTLTISIRL